MQNSPLPEVKVPWVIGREALFEHAAEDFLHEVERQRPWLESRYEELLEDLSTMLDPDGRAPLTAFDPQSELAWLTTVSDAQGNLARRMLSELREYITEWGWIGSR